MTQLKNLFTKVMIGNTELKNRILSTAHQTNHVTDGIPTKDMIAYHEARAKGGIGLIVLEAAAVHPSGMLTTNTVAGFDRRIVEAYSKLSETMHQYGTKVFSQLFHGGREVVSSDYRNAALAPSSVPSLRFSTMPRPMSLEEIEEVIEGFAVSAKLAKEGGLDGVEICCSHGYLPSQFWASHTNLRTDEYGGSFENRMRFIVEVIERVWNAVGDDFTVGIRMSADEMTMDGTTMKDAVQIVEYLADKSRLDFVNVTAGDSSTYAGSTHIVPPSPMKHAYLSAHGFKIRMAGAIPVFVGSRIVDPVEAEQIIATGKADMVGMTRATIVDPDMPNKALKGEFHLIDACIGCLQACIGHYHKGLPISCIQNPQAGKEAQILPLLQKKNDKKSVLVIGAGPGGMEAAVAADTQGYDVTLIDQSDRIGGLLQTMRKAPMRHEMAESMLDNYSKQLAVSNVNVKLGQKVTREEVIALAPDAIICAVGSRSYIPQVEGINDPRVIMVDKIFNKTDIMAGQNAIVFDFGGDWPGIEAAIHLAEKGCKVTLVTTRLHVGEEIHQYLRNEYMKKLYQLNITMKAHHDFGGIINGNVVVRNLFTHKREEMENHKIIVLSVGRVPNTELYEEIKNLAPTVSQIGDCLAPRTIEEATLEGLLAAVNIEDNSSRYSDSSSDYVQV
ncbi:FAD-dependent oxidoreductase [Sporosarcina sp. JAI121]|uniref:oxidoreductase n=1 Tax=Sporosarcina sp. JAI121 TaxID=2723064 RepID=UPI0015C85A8D|nr:FAD-dependent oxidoreductase [Sporosarcina sp. JAI121]NYF24377.1 2,4-dienoyl-CoA reductase-like NADH-dependent reductase (Old Yellow Enzyme family)/thioredoxin reductase [Sporosarcina sp. JAI121]